MSSAARRPGFPVEWEALEASARRLMQEYRAARNRADAAARRVHELEAAVEQLKGGGPDPLALSSRVRELEAENRDLQARLDDAAERVRRLLARTHFLEEER